ncbi:MAG: cyclodeaminase/cyclohydrolase family protein [Candidatus Firestonebacteria bacterium]
MNYLNEPLIKFIENLSARLPAPGGGSASALVGALASSLNCMTANFTIGNEKYKAVESEMETLLLKSEALRDELLSLIKEDIDAYSMVSKANKELKTAGVSAEEKTKKKEELTKKAAEVPFKIMQACNKTLLLCKPMMEKGNKYLLSDVAVAAIFALAALKGAHVNVKINFSCLRDEKYKNEKNEIISKMLKESERLEKEVLAGFSV